MPLLASGRLSGPLRRLVHGAAYRTPPLVPPAAVAHAFGSRALLSHGGGALGAPRAAWIATRAAALPLAPLHTGAPSLLRLSRGLCSSAAEAESASSSGRPFTGAILDGKPAAFMYMESPVRAMATRRFPTLARLAHARSTWHALAHALRGAARLLCRLPRAARCRATQLQARFVNMMMKGGKKQTARTILWGTMRRIRAMRQDPQVVRPPPPATTPLHPAAAPTAYAARRRRRPR